MFRWRTRPPKHSGWVSLWFHRSLVIKDVKDSVNVAIISVIIIHHHHTLTLSPSSSGWLSKHQSLLQRQPIITLPSVSSSSISSNCLPHHHLPAVSLSCSSSTMRNFPCVWKWEENFIITVIVAITVVVFTSLPPAKTRTSNTQQVHYRSHSINPLTVNHAVDHT